MALYNKYRPINLDMVCGQAHVKRILSSQINKNDIVHSYIFYGPAGTGKTTMARIFAAMINCSTGMTSTPPATDPFVEQILSGRSGMDVLEVDAASNRGIDDIKDIREKAYHSPMEMRKRIYIIDECHMLTKEAWNALLKIIEEPPDHVVFILCTTDLQKVITTIKTRCMTIPFKPLTGEDIKTYIKTVATAENMDMEEEAVRLLALAAKGSLRDVLSKLEILKHSVEGRITAASAAADLGVTDRRSVIDFIKAVCAAKFFDALEASSRCITNDGVEVQDFFVSLAEVIHDLMFCNAKGFDMTTTGRTQGEVAEAVTIAEAMARDCGGEYRLMLVEWVKTIQSSYELTVFNVQPQYQCDMAFCEMVRIYHKFKKAHSLKGGKV